MKRFYLKYGHLIATLALFAAVRMVNVACGHVYYQPEMPDAAKKLRKF